MPFTLGAATTAGHGAATGVHSAAEHGAGMHSVIAKGSTAQLLWGPTPVTASKAALEEAHAEAKRLKNEGNKAFMAQQWAEVAKLCTRAIKLWPLYATKLRTTLDAAKKNHEVAVAKA